MLYPLNAIFDKDISLFNSATYLSQENRFEKCTPLQPIIIHSITATTCAHNQFNTLRPRQNGRHFPDDIFKCIFLNENVWISIKISLKFVPKVPINNIPALVQIMAWRQSGDKPLYEPMMVSLLTHICVTRPKWVNHPKPQLSKNHLIPILNCQWIIQSKTMAINYLFIPKSITIQFKITDEDYITFDKKLNQSTTDSNNQQTLFLIDKPSFFIVMNFSVSCTVESLLFTSFQENTTCSMLLALSLKP